jgi:dTDP-4-dehydrorhamnose 3,5-epimerase
MINIHGTNDTAKAKKLASEIKYFTTNVNADARGEFTRIFDLSQLGNVQNINFTPIQFSYSFNISAHTRRGLHVRIQSPRESKLVRPIRGSILDVILDCRVESETFGCWVSTLLESAKGEGILIPGGCAHGIQTLVDDVIVVYAMDVIFDEKLDIAINSEDESLKINWPRNSSVMSPKDRLAMNWEKFLSKVKE